MPAPYSLTDEDFSKITDFIFCLFSITPKARPDMPAPIIATLFLKFSTKLLCLFMIKKKGSLKPPNFKNFVFYCIAIPENDLALVHEKPWRLS